MRSMTVPLTLEQIRSLHWMEVSDSYDISRVPSGRSQRCLEIEFTHSESGGHHLYVKDKEEDNRYYMIARDGNITACYGDVGKARFRRAV